MAKEYLKAARAMLKPSVKVVRDEDTARRAIVETDLGEEEIGKYVGNWSQSDEGNVVIAKPTGSDPPGSDDRKAEVNPWAKHTFNLTKQGEIARADPAKA